MAVLWAGGRPESLSLAVGSTFANGTNGRDTAFFAASNAAQSGTRESYGAFAAQTSLWFHAICASGATASLTAGASILAFSNGTTAQLRLTATSNSTTTNLEIKVEKTTDGTTYTQLGSDVFLMPAATMTYDFEIVTGGSGTFKVWRDGKSVFSFTGDVTTQTTINRVAFSSHHTSAVSSWSEMIAADSTTIGMKLFQMWPNAAGDTVTWTGAYTTIDDTTYDETDYIETNTVNNVSIFNHSDMTSTLIGSRTVSGVFLAAAGTIQAASTPTDVQGVVKTGGSTFTSASQGFSTAGARSLLAASWTVNPNTTAAWVLSELNAIQLGCKAV